MSANTASDIRYTLEEEALCLSNAILNLKLIHDALYSDINAMERTQAFLGTGHLMECIDAMNVDFRELDRILGEMDKLVDTAYMKGV